ncbi:MAG TPA: bacterial Ig-like domain-containing protein [Bacillaceae bacterium]
MLLLSFILIFSSLPIFSAEAKTEDPIVLNSGFEMEEIDGKIPHWSTYPDSLRENTFIKRTNEEHAKGNYSLLIDDRSAGASVGLMTDHIPIQGGKTYTASFQAKVVSGRTVVYLRYFDSAKKQLSEKSAIMDTKAEWTAIELESKAPDNAAYGVIMLYSGVANVTKAYYDDVRLKAEQTFDMPTEFGEPVNLGPGPLAGQAQGAAIGDGEIYFANSGSPAVFYAVDSETGAVNFKQTMPGLDVVWAVTIGSDGNVYFAGTSNGIVYRYLPKEKKIENLGTNGTGDRWVWELEASNDGKVYGATYPQGKVFEFDIATDTFKDLGRLHPEQQYTRGLGVTDDAVYAGTGSTAYLYRIDRKTYEKTEIPTPVTGADTMISNIWEYNNRLFVANGTSLHVLDLETFEPIRSLIWSDEVASDGFVSPPSPYDSNIVYLKNKNTFHLWSYNMETDKLAKVEPTINMPTTSTKTMKWIKQGEKDVLAMISTRNEYLVYDPTTGSSSVTYPKVELSGLDIQALEAGPDGNIYLSGYQGSIAVYDTKDMKYSLQERDPHQIEGIGFLNDKVYMGAYGGARIYEYDPSKPYAFSANNETNNPKQIYAVPTLQSRPFTFASGDDMLFTGTIPDYGKLGGTFAMYDSKSGKWDAFENIVPNQSIIGLAYKDGKVFGGSGIWGGLGIDPSETAAKMFEFDVESKTASVFELKVPGLKNPQMIGELSFGPDGLLWGVAFGQDNENADIYALFAMEPVTKEIKKHKLLMKNSAKGSSWRPFFLRWGQDGYLYTTIARQLIVVDPETLLYTNLVDGAVNLMDMDSEGNVYYAKGSNLYKLPIIAHMTDADIKELPKKLTYYKGEAFDPEGLVVEASYSNGTTKILEPGQYTMETEDVFTTAGEKTVTITIQDLPEKTITFKVTVMETENTNVMVLQPELEGQTAHAETAAQALQEAFRHAPKNKGVQKVHVYLNELSGAEAYDLTLPTEFLARNGKNKRIEVNTEFGAIELQGHMLSNAKLRGEETVTLTVARGNAENLDGSANEAGNRAIVGYSFSVNGTPVTFRHPGADVEVFIPYDLTAEEAENPEQLTVLHIDNDGNAAPVSSAKYDVEKEGMIFRTAQFGQFAIVQSK